ncbi:tyrosine-type recombinase/integrase [Aporhodopirellula rubra]|uniref:tyrosine-type recombinase/integrase n=1 Tax=Aporhodopirellula rubra TaxID=980271 RepID=UPI001FEC0929|nr:phage integrase SAM-like domain-containing protein [Aporhodopirellula rubra]
MASLSREEKTEKRTGGYRLQFRDASKRKRSIWLGDVTEAKAEDIQAHVEHLIVQTKKQRPPESATADWLASVDNDLRNKLAKCGLCESVTKRVSRDLTLVAWIDEYVAEREDVKPSTKLTYSRGRAKLVDYFGKRKRLRDVTVEDARKWRIAIKTKGNLRDKDKPGLSEETTRKMTALAKLFFGEAMARGLIDSNPFAGLASTGQGNEKNQHFVESTTIESLMDHCPCGDWRLILALTRYGGLRCPSELIPLRRSDIDLEARKMTITASKTEHHSSGGIRVCPIFPELHRHLQAAWDAMPDGPTSPYVINRYRRPDQNLGTTFLKILTRGGVEPWPRLFQNLRASRETELMARYPAKDVASWLGNSVPTAMKHYAMATDEAFKAASDPEATTVASGTPKPTEESEDATSGTDASGGSISGESGAIEPEEGTAVVAANPAKTPENPRENGFSIVQDNNGDYYLVGLAGLEPAT